MRTLALCAALLCTAGCRYSMRQVEEGTPFARCQFDAIEIGTGTRGDLLAAFGPPDSILYTLKDEVLEYRYGHHDGSDLEFFLPTSITQVNSLVMLPQSILALFLPPVDEPAPFAKDNPLVRATELLLGEAGTYAPFVSGDTAITLEGRALRYSRMRFILERGSRLVISKSYAEAPGNGEDDLPIIPAL